MTDPDLESRLSRQMDAATADRPLDLERLSEVSSRDGRRLRRRRTAITSLGAVACVGLLATGVALVSGGSGDQTRQEPGLAAEPTQTETSPVETTPPTQPVATPQGGAPFILDLEDWTCGEFMDEKTICEERGKLHRSVQITLRDQSSKFEGDGPEIPMLDGRGQLLLSGGDAVYPAAVSAPRDGKILVVDNGSRDMVKLIAAHLHWA